MKSIFMQGGYQDVGTRVKICFEGKVTRGELVDSDDYKHIICVKDLDGKIHWSHESHVSLDHPESPLRR